MFSPKDWLGIVVLTEEILDNCHTSGEAKRGEDEYNDPEIPEALDHNGVVLCRSVNEDIFTFGKFFQLRKSSSTCTSGPATYPSRRPEPA